MKTRCILCRHKMEYTPGDKDSEYFEVVCHFIYSHEKMHEKKMEEYMRTHGYDYGDLAQNVEPYSEYLIDLYVNQYVLKSTNSTPRKTKRIDPNTSRLTEEEFRDRAAPINPVETLRYGKKNRGDSDDLAFYRVKD